MNKKLVQEFIYYKKSKGEIKSQEDFALKIGYLSKSSFSQALAKDPLPLELIKKINNVYPDFENWRKDQDNILSSQKNDQKEFEDMDLREQLLKIYKQNQDIKDKLENLSIKQNISNKSSKLYLKSIMEYLGINMEALSKDLHKEDISSAKLKP